MLHSLVEKNRSYRRFDQSVKIPMETLRSFVELARLSPSASNLQPLKFILVNTPEACAKVFPTLAWAGYLTDWAGPAEGERPSAYIVILSDPEINAKPEKDVGIASQSILLGAVEQGYGGCLIGSVKRTELQQSLNIPEGLKIELVVALGKPKEIVQIEEAKNNNIRYWRDENQVHHVPKRPLNDLIIGEI